MRSTQADRLVGGSNGAPQTSVVLAICPERNSRSCHYLPGLAVAS